MKLFYGWPIVGAAAMGGVFPQPISAALGWSQADIASATLTSCSWAPAHSLGVRCSRVRSRRAGNLSASSLTTIPHSAACANSVVRVRVRNVTNSSAAVG